MEIIETCGMKSLKTHARPVPGYAKGLILSSGVQYIYSQPASWIYPSYIAAIEGCLYPWWNTRPPSSLRQNQTVHSGAKLHLNFLATSLQHQWRRNLSGCSGFDRYTFLGHILRFLLGTGWKSHYVSLTSHCHKWHRTSADCGPSSS